MKVEGVGLDQKTRCHHYHNHEDVVAIRFYCCGNYYACIHCHEELAGHEVERWPEEKQGEKAILCGNCNTEFSINDYRNRADCPLCGHPFNPGCRLHFPHYFE